MIALLLAALAAGPVQVQGLVVDGRPALRVAGDDLQETTVTRAAEAVHVCLGGAGTVELLPALPGAPAVSSGPSDCGQRIVVEAEEGLPYEVRREPGVLLVLLGEEGVTLPRASDFSDFQALAFQLWPGRALPEGSLEDSAAVEEDEELVFRFGPLQLRPLLSLFVSFQASTPGDTPQPERYGTVILEPGLRATTNLLDGRLQLQYVPTFRRFRNAEWEPGTAGLSHHANGRLGLDLRPLVRLDAHARYAYGELEAEEVDPGREYFFGLRPFEQWGAGAVLGYDGAGLADIDLSLDWARTDLRPGSQYFDNDTWSARATLRRDLGADRALSLFYHLGWTDRVPDRPVAQSDVRELGVEWTGQWRPEWPLSLSAARQTRSHPNARDGSRSFTGWVARADTSHQFARGLTAELGGQRATYLSGFEDSGYYDHKGGRLQLSGGLPLRLRFAIRGALSRNDYPLPAAALGVPRRDEIRTFAVGLARSVRDSFFVRLDYQVERRISNLPGYSTRTSGFMLGVGFSRRKELL